VGPPRVQCWFMADVAVSLRYNEATEELLKFMGVGSDHSPEWSMGC
jgi:hypothetical protein